MAARKLTLKPNEWLNRPEYTGLEIISATGWPGDTWEKRMSKDEFDMRLEASVSISTKSTLIRSHA